VTLSVCPLLKLMHRSINFDDQRSLIAIEVDNKGADGLLPPELVSV